MALSLSIPGERQPPERRYLRAPKPLHFPVSEVMPDGDEHFERRILLYSLVKHAFGERALVTSDLFVYWDPTDPGKRLAPDLAVRVDTKAERLLTWKTWQRGAPHVGVEIVSKADTPERRRLEKLDRYQKAGILEAVRFDPHAERPLRLWDLLDGDIVERDPDDPLALHCDAMGLYWCVTEEPGLGPTLRLARDAAGRELLLTPAEAEAARATAEAARAEAALARVAELEALVEKNRR